MDEKFYWRRETVSHVSILVLNNVDIWTILKKNYFKIRYLISNTFWLFLAQFFHLTITCYPMSSCNECIVFLFIHFGFLILSLNLCLIVGFVSVGRRSKLHLPALRTFLKDSSLPYVLQYIFLFELSFTGILHSERQ